MLEILRKRRNKQELDLLHPAFRRDFEVLVRNLELQGFRPRLQGTWRTVTEQQRLYALGRSTLYGQGPHTNILPGSGKPAALATHILNDNAPLDDSPEWFARLAIEANEVDLRTGLMFGLSDTAEERLHAEKMRLAIDAHALKVLSILVRKQRGWDPLHVEIPNWRAYLNSNAAGVIGGSV